MLVIGTPRSRALAKAVRKLVRQLGREINYTVLAVKEFKSRRNRKDAFLANLWRGKRVSLIGPDKKACREAHPNSDQLQDFVLGFSALLSAGLAVLGDGAEGRVPMETSIAVFFGKTRSRPRAMKCE